MEPNSTSPKTFTMQSTLKRLLPDYSSAFVIGAILTYIYVILLIRTGHLILLILAVPLYVYIFSDLFIWLRNGIRAVEVDSLGLTIHRPHDRAPVRIQADQITGVFVSRFLDRTTIIIVLDGGTVKRFMGMKRYSGPRIRMTNEPFDRVQFLDFVRRVTNLRRIAQSPQ
jgi:hypothetical protein